MVGGRIALQLANTLAHWGASSSFFTTAATNAAVTVVVAAEEVMRPPRAWAPPQGCDGPADVHLNGAELAALHHEHVVPQAQLPRHAPVAGHEPEVLQKEGGCVSGQQQQPECLWFAAKHILAQQLQWNALCS